MFISMHTNQTESGDTVFRVRALKLGDYYVGSENFGSYDFTVRQDWDPHPACVAILETLSKDNDRPIKVTLGEHTIRIDPVVADELFDCLFAFTIIKDHQ